MSIFLQESNESQSKSLVLPFASTYFHFARQSLARSTIYSRPLIRNESPANSRNFTKSPARISIGIRSPFEEIAPLPTASTCSRYAVKKKWGISPSCSFTGPGNTRPVPHRSFRRATAGAGRPADDDTTDAPVLGNCNRHNNSVQGWLDVVKRNVIPAIRQQNVLVSNQSVVDVVIANLRVCIFGRAMRGRLQWHCQMEMLNRREGESCDSAYL